MPSEPEPDPGGGHPAWPDPRVALGRLADAGRTVLIGVRHHSPALAAAVPALLDAARPEALLVELPAEMQPWLAWLAHPQTWAPVALGAAGGEGDGPLAFYPFADFSPELAALRWAERHGVPAYCCDLPLADATWQERPAPGRRSGPPGFGHTIRSALTGRVGDDLWDRWVEAAAPGSPAEAVRRAALAVGWALRQDVEVTSSVSALDLRREEWMRRRIDETPGRIAVLVGAFHAPALAEPVGAFHAPALAESVGAAPSPPPPGTAPPAGALGPGAAGTGPVISLVPYSFDLLDERSGYPAGIRDPRWQQAVYESSADPVDRSAQTRRFAVEITRHLRGQGHPTGPVEAAEVARLAGDLARLRNLPAPGRGELVEALQTVLAQGEPAGRGRAVAAAMQHVLVGDRRGRPCPRTPACGLHPSTVSALRELRLPGPGEPARVLRLDPLRSPLDRRRDAMVHRLAACQVPYAEAGDATAQAGLDTLTTRWRLNWVPATDAALAAAGLHGVTLAQAAAGMLAQRRRREISTGGPTPAQAIAGLTQAAACGLTEPTHTRLGDLRTAVTGAGTLAELIAAIQLLQKLRRGHFVNLPSPPAGLDQLLADLDAACLAAVDGLAGSTRTDDARALLTLVQNADASGHLLRLRHAVARLAAHGSPLMRGAAHAVQVVLGVGDPAAFGQRLASWAELPGAECTDRLRGTLSVAGALLQAGGEALTPLLNAIDGWSDDVFTRRLPALRGGFEALSPADRDRLLDTVRQRLGDVDATLTTDPVVLAQWLTVDGAGRDALETLGLMPGGPVPEEGRPERASGPDTRARGQLIPPPQRWRLLLGRRRDELSGRARRLATALDELYGAGRGEGAYTAGSGGGREAAYPQVREWADDLEALFGATVRDEVLARAAEAGRLDAMLEISPEQVRPSVELLHTVLALAGGLPEARLRRLRPLVARLVAELTAELARRVRPALTGLNIRRRTRRPTGRLDVGATLRANLHTARTGTDGTVQVLPERFVFASRGRRSVDWQVVLLVDVSGSMEPSTIWAALTASVLAGVPSLRTHFVTFSTEVVDLTDRVTDPLSLLLEIHVGGGTHIAAALRYARQIITTPARTMVVLVSDFEEGHPTGDLLAAVRVLAGDGVTLLGCASLDDRGQPRYSTAVAGQLVAAGMPVAALSPTELARWIGDQVR